MPPIYLFLLFPILIPLVLLWLTNRFHKEFLLHALGFIGGGVLVFFLIILAFTSYTPKDVEILNGFVTGKEINRFTCPVNTWNPCENGYSCNCRQVSYSCSDSNGKTKTCYRTECDTCYKYPWEQNFFVDSSLQGERAYKIERVDAQGAVTPPRWAQTHRGDPVSIKHSYKNYLAGVSDSIFHEDGKAEAKYLNKIPTYPLDIYDYYRIDRLVTVGKVTVNRRVWNEQISRALVYVGPEKQANIVVVIAEGVSMDFANAVRRAWKGFKKNDLVVFIGVDATGKVTWTRTMSWSKASIVNIKIEGDLLTQFNGKALEPVAVMEIVKKDMLQHFDRRSMEEFEYLKDQNPLSGARLSWMMAILIVLQVAASLLQLYFSGGIPFTNLAYTSYYTQIRRASYTPSYQPPYGTRTVARVLNNTIKRSIPGNKSRFKP